MNGVIGRRILQIGETLIGGNPGASRIIWNLKYDSFYNMNISRQKEKNFQNNTFLNENLKKNF